MKRLIILSFLVILSILCFFLFEPVATYYFGREELADLSSLQPKVNHKTTIDTHADKILKAEFNTLKTPALSVSININNKLIWSNIIGYADFENQIIADSLTKFRIGSVSKSLTSIGLGVLIQNNKIKTESFVKDFIPYTSDLLSNLTVKQLASHASGIRNYGSCFCFPIWEFYDNNQYNTIEESIAVFNNDKLLFQPGTSFNYSTYNYTLLSAMMEKASNKDFLFFMEETIFQPLKMAQTVADKKSKEIMNIAKFYDVEDGNSSESYPINSSGKWAGGGFLSTTNDLVKFGSAVLHHKLLDATNTRKLFTPVKLNSGLVNEQNYGLGWRNEINETVFKDKRKTNIIYHGGSAVGSTAILILLPEYNATVAVTMNRSGNSSELFDVAYKIADLYINVKK